MPNIVACRQNKWYIFFNIPLNHIRLYKQDELLIRNNNISHIFKTILLFSLIISISADKNIESHQTNSINTPSPEKTVSTLLSPSILINDAQIRHRFIRQPKPTRSRHQTLFFSNLSPEIFEAKLENRGRDEFWVYIDFDDTLAQSTLKKWQENFCCKHLAQTPHFQNYRLFLKKCGS